MKKEKKMISFQLSKKAEIGLKNAGFLDGRDGSIRPGTNLSKFLNNLIGTYVTERTKGSLIDYYKACVGELNVKKEEYFKKCDEQIKKYAEAVEKIKNGN